MVEPLPRPDLYCSRTLGWRARLGHTHTHTDTQTHTHTHRDRDTHTHTQTHTDTQTHTHTHTQRQRHTHTDTHRHTHTHRHTQTHTHTHTRAPHTHRRARRVHYTTLNCARLCCDTLHQTTPYHTIHAKPYCNMPYHMPYWYILVWVLIIYSYDYEVHGHQKACT